MLTRFFTHLRAAGLKPGVQEHLALLAALKAGLAETDIDRFHALARTCLIKDESQFDRFDRAFAGFFEGLAPFDEALLAGQLPEDWLRAQAELNLSPEQMAQIQALGDWDTLMATLRQRLEEQRERHQGGNRWIGTGGTSAFGHSGFNPEGVRIGGASRQRRAVKVWEQRAYRDLDDRVELGTRHFKLALRRLRRLARTGAAEELDLDDTIAATARNAGHLDLKLRPERHNAIKILLLLDVGGSMDDHIRIAERLFSAARSEFKHLEHFYFHNCVYEKLWKQDARRWSEATGTEELLHRYNGDWRLIFIGDASMSPYELTQAGGSVEHFNAEPGLAWVQRLLAAFPHAAWLNPVQEEHWPYTASIGMLSKALQGRMYPLTLDGLGRAIEALKKKGTR